MPTQTYSVTAPNGKTLDVTGDHVPTEAELHDIFAKAGVDTAPAAPVVPGSERTRVDTNMVGIDHEKVQQAISNWASTLHPRLQKPAAMLAAFPADALASLVEMFSSPETVATAGAKPALAAMDKVGAATSATGRAVASAVTSPRVIAAAAQLAKHVPTAAGAYMGGAPGAIVGQQIGEALAEQVQSIRPRVATLPASAPAAPTAPAPQSVPPPSIQAASQLAQMSGALTDEEARAVDALVQQGYPREDVLAAVQQHRGAPSAPAPAATAARPILNSAEYREYARMKNAGKSDADAYALISANRALAGGKTATDAQMKASVAHRNSTGRW